jgi:hypothetical protein
MQTQLLIAKRIVDRIPPCVVLVPVDVLPITKQSRQNLTQEDFD